ncbi:MAG TPA: hypothetical protein VN696_18560 [Pyrinomonadaceae bacterium]|nr:hypothetical protein [Pyrinomonadaceae bacterium]
MSTNATNQNQKAISGSWGGADIALEVTTEGVEINFDCGTGHIDKAIVPDAEGKFSVDGTYVREHGGAMRSDETQDRKAATYKGTVNREKMSLSVTLTEGHLEIGSFTLERGKPGRVRKCM